METLPTKDQSNPTRQAALTDTDRINALFTLFGGAYAFEPFFRIQEKFQKGRRGLDEWIAANPSLLEKPEYRLSPK